MYQVQLQAVCQNFLEGVINFVWLIFMRIVFNSSQETLFQSEVSLKDLSTTMAGLFNAVVSAGKFV